MQYQLNTTNYHTFEIFEVNKLPGRSYFIPYPTREQADSVSMNEKRYASEKVMCLNGDWDFHFYPHPADLPAILDTDKVAFDKMPVPGCWQFHGYDRPFYVNIRYQFPFKPPVIPTTESVGRVFTWMGVDQKISLRFRKPEEYNFVGVYRKKLQIEDPTKNHVISFLGVASCLDLYLNGSFVGYSEGAHNTAEFDLTGKLQSGENEIVCVVHRWCNSTYLEGQDMFRNNGIFRDVLLRISEKTDIREIQAVTEKKGNTYSLSVSCETFSDTPVTFTLEGNGLKVTKLVQSTDRSASFTFEGLKVQEWSAEDPVLYTLFYETKSCCVRERIGFKTVEIQGDVLLFNGKKIKFKGVNHHDTSPTGGYTMTPEEIERDVRICKDFNIDTIRTSHYPPDPLLLEYADELGIYIVDENDLETHGTFAHQLPPTYNTISHDPKWQKHYLDRITRLYARDKIHANTSIFMWSLGNEAGGYANTDAMYDFLKAHSSLPVHYESAVHCKRIAYDVGSEMYPSVQMVHDVGEHQRKQKPLNDRPYFMCEYAHAMGVGPGNTEAYWKEIYTHDNLIGGCVWEMVDHAVYHEDGTYTYGGDHGEWEHDHNFCVDGMFYPDRTPSTGARIMKFIYRPIRVTSLGKDHFEIFNTTAFSAGSRYALTFTWNDGTAYTVSPDVGPLQKKTVTLKTGKKVDGKQLCLVTTVDTKTGEKVAEEELVLALNAPAAPAVTALPAACRISEGHLSLPLGKGANLTSATPSTLLYRAPTDNDTDLMFRNTMAPFLAQTEKLVEETDIPGGKRIVTEVKNKKATFTVTDTYEGTAEGILVTSHIHLKSGGGILPRFGKTYQLPTLFDHVTYEGRTGESYCDMKDQFPIATVSCQVADMTEPNIRPQESGNRCDCTYVSLSDGKDKVTFRAVDTPFELSIKPYTDLALCKMEHRQDEKQTGVYVTIEAFQQGIGTGACGPAIMPEFQYDAKKDYTLRFLISTQEEGKA
ncbi:MAG: hypothetical protein IJ708_05210 [Clostridia bacterium]|nr:hypothetical protein [Clostridia bacterium]